MNILNNWNTVETMDSIDYAIIEVFDIMIADTIAEKREYRKYAIKRWMVKRQRLHDNWVVKKHFIPRSDIANTRKRDLKGRFEKKESCIPITEFNLLQN